MSEFAIRVTNLGKRYRLGAARPNRLLSQAIGETLQQPLRAIGALIKTGTRRDSIWALKDINVEIERNDIVGVVGRNGSGKSTLLKILSGITEPTEGHAELRGRTASLLEVGTGFHPELSGRENVYLNGAILGMRRSEIEAKFDEIVNFSEIAKFIDTPVKHYSSGMAVRLAFAVAAHLDPEILMVDEVLAVGDLKFQRKCLDKMQDVVKRGKTILFVTHQMNAVRRLCTKCIWLEAGSIKMFGPTAKVVSAYESASMSRSLNAFDGKVTQAVSQFVGWSIDSNTDEPHVLDNHGEFTVKFTVNMHRPLIGGHLGIALWNGDEQLMWGNAVQNLTLETGSHDLSFTIPGLPLRPGGYRWHVSLWSDTGLIDEWYAVPDMIISTEPLTHNSDDWAGVLNIPCDFKIKHLSSIADV